MELPTTKPAFSDLELQSRIKQLVIKYNVAKIYETGTYYGESVKILSELFPELPIYSYELNPTFFNIAKQRNENKKLVTIRNMSSVDGLQFDLEENQNNVVLFLDAHWMEYWPILDELQVIASKKIKPYIIIHDFYVPAADTSPKFGYDTYKGQPLNYDYIRGKLVNIYGENGFRCAYSDKPTLNAGVIYIVPYEEKHE